MKNFPYLFVCATTLLASNALADPARTLTLDLDRDGSAETFEISDDGESLTTLTIRRPGKPAIVARDIAWSLEPASLTRARNGSVFLHTSHIGIGRSPHEQTLTIAYRGGTYQIVGLTRNNWDRIDPKMNTRCDINFLTGQGTVNNKTVRRSIRAKPVTTWVWDQTPPVGCYIP